MRDEVAPKHFPDRWRLSRAGIVNVWHYLEETFDLSGGRMILRGTNGAGKSRALEMLLPFLLDADRRKMDATGSGKVNLDELMRTGADEQANRMGYLWLELQGLDGHLTLGALIRHGRSTKSTQVWYFMTPRRVGVELELLNEHREPLSRDGLSQVIGVHAITDSPETHRERVRTTVFGLDGDSGRDRYVGLLQLLHTLRSPDVGNRIDEGRLPLILSDSLPPLEEQTLNQAGEQLDGLTTLRQSQQRLEESLGHVDTFLGVYRRYAAGVLVDTASATLAAVGELDDAEQAATQCAADAERLRAERASCEITLGQRGAEVDELQNAINGIRAREIFKQADDLVQRDKVVTTLATAADRSLAEAARERDHHKSAVQRADERLGELRDTLETAAPALAQARDALRSAALPDSSLPNEVRLVETLTDRRQEIVRVEREAEPRAVAQPIACRADLVPADLDAATFGVQSGIDAAHKRRDLAERRLHEAKRLATAAHQIERLEENAETAQAQADQDDAQAARDADIRDDAAVSLAETWRAWTNDPATRDLLGDIDWRSDEHVAPLLADVAALAGDADADLDLLDTSAARRARPASESITTAVAELDREDREDDASRRTLDDEAAALRSQRDPAPAHAPWLAPERPGVPLWRAVDFAADLSARDRAGLEAALLASGLLTATVEADGSLRATDGTTLLSPSAPATRPLNAALVVDPASSLDAALVNQVLSSIGLADDSPSSVSLDGNWRHGPLRGRHTIAAARHIGAAARAQARQERLIAIAAELAALDERAAQRRTRRDELTLRAASIDAHVGTAPRSASLQGARAVAQASIDRSSRSRTAVREISERASAARAAWARELATHRSACELHGLPSGADALVGAVAGAGEAEARCRRLLDELKRLGAQHRRHESSVTAAGEASRRRDEAQGRADEQWHSWHDAAAEVAALHEAIDLTVEQARDELQRSETAHAAAKTAVEAAQRAFTEVNIAVARAESEAAHAAEHAAQQRMAMIAAAHQLSHRASLPGLVRAVGEFQLPAIERPELADPVRVGARALLDVIKRPAQPATETVVFNAFRVFDREVSGQLDVSQVVDDGITVIAVHGAGDDSTLAGAAAALQARAESGRAALSDREREVFTTFVLGGVGEELRRRINQASALVDAMNASLRTIRTSNGIGVRLGWQLSDDAPALRRIAELVKTADAVRTPEQNGELTELLRQRVDESYAADPSSGYATHLANALDYRRWYGVGVTILGPNPGQERRLSVRAKLSQGETRFVSYVTLFAAVDGYLSGLSDSGRQLRLLLLDDAFAKVDDPTIAELMGLLVRLDLDFVMTGHSLWGCFPQVPRLDVYEVRRQDGTSAVMTHVHWDGHRRHLQSTA